MKASLLQRRRSANGPFRGNLIENLSSMFPHLPPLPSPCPSPPSPIAEIKTNVVSDVATYGRMKGSQACCTLLQKEGSGSGEFLYLLLLPLIHQ